MNQSENDLQPSFKMVKLCKITFQKRKWNFTLKYVKKMLKYIKCSLKPEKGTMLHLPDWQRLKSSACCQECG